MDALSRQFSTEHLGSQVAGTRLFEERTQAPLDLLTAAVAGRSKGAIVCRVHVGTRDLVAVTLKKPMDRRHARLGGKDRVLGGEVPRGTAKREGIARRALRQRDGFVQKPGVLGSREPLSLVAWEAFNEA